MRPYRDTPTYRAWAGAIQRCTNPNRKSYPHYGARGISICGRWRESFENFIEDMGECPAGLSIDRIDNDGNYEPGNCKWSTRSEQVKNRRLTATLLTSLAATRAKVTANQWGPFGASTRTHCAKGHALEVIDKRGKRGCKTCNREYQRLWAANKRHTGKEIKGTWRTV